MQVHDLSRVRITAPPTQGSAVVLELREHSYMLRAGRDVQPLSARRAASCLLEPVVGDRVWFVVEEGVAGQQCAWVTAILEREAGEAPARLSVEGTSELRVDAPKLTLRAATRLDLQADELRVRGRLAQVLLDECSSVVRTVFTHARKVTIVSTLIETLAERISAHSQTSQRTVEHIDQVKAGTIDYTAVHSARVAAEHALISGAEIVKVDGGQIHLG